MIDKTTKSLEKIIQKTEFTKNTVNGCKRETKKKFENKKKKIF